MIVPFQFQRGNKIAGCEDAPPLTNEKFSIICDGLGGSGSIKHQIIENGSNTPVNRTSGFLGSRIVSESVESYYSKNYSQLAIALAQGHDFNRVATNFLVGLKNQISDSFSKKISEYNIDMSKATKTLKIFPTTLASTLYFKIDEKLYVLAIWAGDSRVYVLNPQNGLQLLSLDDAKDAEDEMKSASEMDNCISAGQSFHLNYALYDMKDPGIVFSCSDGCFDYLQSPLHFEWLLLQTILECVPKVSGSALGIALGNSIKECMYHTIGDDTTMAGIIYGIDSMHDLKELYKPRMDLFGHLALEMNDSLKNLKSVQTEKESAQKKCRLYESKVENEMRIVVCNALREKAPTSLYHFLTDLPCYCDYQAMIASINSELDEKCTVELTELNVKLAKEKEICKELLLRDYLKWTQEANEEAQFSQQTPFSIFSMPGTLRSRETSVRNKSAYLYPAYCRQPLKVCIELLRHPDFEQVTRYSYGSPNGNTDNIQSQISQMESILNLLENNDPLFINLWSQAYFSTDRYEKTRFEAGNSRQFLDSFEAAIHNTNSCYYMSELTARRFAEYRNDANGLYNIQQKYANERTRRISNILEAFFDKHKQEIVTAIILKPTNFVLELFIGTGISADRFAQYLEAIKTLDQIDLKIAKAKDQVDKIWNNYKKDYQLFKIIGIKGAC